jgi:UDP-N-acetylglucosamine--N-acetylmuramyl-(pentapeptide) pyrophosphoryl-undecaprenol N-acetylglucosamine transferase
VDDHQTVNAQFLVNHQAAWLMPQSSLTATGLAEFIQSINREQLLQVADKAYGLRKTQAALDVVQACEEVSA